MSNFSPPPVPSLRPEGRSIWCARRCRLTCTVAAAAGATPALAGPVLDPNSITPYIEGFVTCRLTGELPAGIEPSRLWITNLEPMQSLQGFAIPFFSWNAPAGPQVWSGPPLGGEWLPYIEGPGTGSGFWLWGVGGQETGGSAPSIAVPGSQLPVVPLPSALLLCSAAAPILAIAWRRRRRLTL